MANIDKIKLSGVTYNIVDTSAVHSLDGYYTSQQTDNAITAATNALAESIANQGYQTASQVQQAVADGITGKTDNSTFTAYTASTATELAKKFEGVAYDSTSKRINFYGDAERTGSVLAYIDATGFIKDGMVSNVEVKKVEGVDNLVISFNTDAGKSDINIPISNIFDATNYYTKTEVDTALAGKQATLASGTNIKTINGQSILGSGDIVINEGGTIDSTLDSTSTNAVQNKVVKNALDGKQDTLVSGTSIKTINSTSLLGSGDVATMKARVVDTSTLEFYW